MDSNDYSNWINIIWVGIIYFGIYYFLFRTLIRKFNFVTPGREDDEAETKLYTRKDVNAAKEDKSALILEGLGGKDNLVNVDCCATRLRVTVKDSSLVKDPVLKESGASGIIKSGSGVQVIYGPRVTVIKSNLEDYIDSLS